MSQADKICFILYQILFPILQACPRGYFGNECSEKCNDRCVGCNNVNGLCDFGCIPGWRGDFCNEGSTYTI